MRIGLICVWIDEVSEAAALKAPRVPELRCEGSAKLLVSELRCEEAMARWMVDPAVVANPRNNKRAPVASTEA